MEKKIWLSSPHIDGDEQEFIDEAFRTNWIAPVGPNVNGFEEDLQRYTGVKYAAALSSGTAAIHLGLIILNVKPGDIVLCQSLTFSASANPVVYLGATPVFIDSEPDTWNMSPEHLTRAIISCISGELVINGKKMEKPLKPKAVIPVHLYGMPAKMAEILAVARKFDIPVLEDAAEALGSCYHGKSCSSMGNIGILSFNGNKIITTSAGGALLSDDENYVKRAKFLASQSKDPAPHYQHSEIGYNYRMSNILAGLGRGQMKVLNRRVYKRRAINTVYREMMKNVEGISFQAEPEGHFSNFWLTTIQVNPKKTGGITREDVRLRLEEDNIEARPLWKPLHLQPVFSTAPYFGSGVSEELFEKGLCLPSGSNLTKKDFQRIRISLGSLFKRNLNHVHNIIN